MGSLLLAPVLILAAPAAAEEKAKRVKRGLWRGVFEAPRDWRRRD